MGYYNNNESKLNNSVNHRRAEMSTENTSNSNHNNSVLLPELKSITPSISNVKQSYAILNNGSSSYTGSNSAAKLINRKKSYEKILKIDS